ncbi:hypothetical protein [Phenylobacterium ferrooxidans]|uniref:Uncharacterized protein n=1 Tax=Phenylobacterium ferrooxidans TaxID=2982689 RepID=A0ABW6CTC4_9CAUL
MPNIGFSAYLKLISLNERPRDTAIRGRVSPTGRGYDFHRSMKRAAQRLLAEGAPLDEVLATLAAIKRPSERLSAMQALTRLAAWRAENPGEFLTYKPATYAHSSGLFKVAFTPDFGVRLGRAGTAVHIWNTQKPKLTPRTVYAALSLFPELYEDGGAPDDFALLSLREPQLFRLSEAGRYAGLGQSMAEKVAESFRLAVADLVPDHTPDHPGSSPG